MRNGESCLYFWPLWELGSFQIDKIEQRIQVKYSAKMFVDKQSLAVQFSVFSVLNVSWRASNLKFAKFIKKNLIDLIRILIFVSDFNSSSHFRVLSRKVQEKGREYILLLQDVDTETSENERKRKKFFGI